MRVLLDTHTFLWWNLDSPLLSQKARETIAGGRAEIYLSAVSAWEIAIKTFKGKLILTEPPEKYVFSRMNYYRFLSLPIQMSHALRTFQLPPVHNDPFDRLLVAQCQLESMSLLTGDEMLHQYDVDIIW